MPATSAIAIRTLAEADASCGAKAAGLARLIAAGLPVPEGFVLDRSVFRELAGVDHTALPFGSAASPGGAGLVDDAAVDSVGHVLAEAGQRIADAMPPAELDRELSSRAAALGRLAVRSSASIEDGELGSAAGVFASVTDVAPDDVWDAIRAVWTSALTPLAVAYARRRAGADQLAAPIAMSVIIQRFVPGVRRTVYTRTPGAPDGDELWLSRDGDPAMTRLARANAGDDRDAALALAAEAAIAAPRGADVELVQEPGGARTWIVQARPIIHGRMVRRERPAPPPILLASLRHDGRRWTWDIAHNPDPLSPAQTGLVEHVDRAACTPYALRVCGGYLYTAPREGPIAPRLPPVARADLEHQIAAIEARFVLGEPDDLAEAVARYVAFMAIWAGELSPLVAAARRKLPDQLAQDGHPVERILALVAALIGKRALVRDPVMSPAWDVAVPTFTERGEPPPVAPASREAFAEPAPDAHRVAPADIELARAAAEAGDADDRWFARAQWMVRRALLVHGARLALRDDDVFWLPLDDLVTLRSIDPVDAHRRASAARAAHARASAWDMPIVVHGPEPARVSPADLPDHPGLLHGVGIGPPVTGRVVRFASLAAATRVKPGDVVVTRAITPALAMLVDGCAALVSETGGLLDHGAALARELGITCVVGCTGAWTQLSDGAMVSVDGYAGLVGLAPLTRG